MMTSTPTNILHKSLLAILLASLILAGCLPGAGFGLNSVASDPTLFPNQTAAAPVASSGDAAPTMDPLNAALDPQPVETQSPLRFSLPTPGQAPISLWRPPLYRTPWALGPYDHFYFARPIAADKVNWPLADYRYGGNFPGTDVVHTGIDIDAPKGTPVLAAADGEVVWAGYGLMYGAYNEKDPYGKAVAIKHPFGWNGQRLYTNYAHMDRVDVQVGQEVKAGQQLGLVGETGNVTGPHLHFEVRVKKNSFFSSLNPELWLSPPQGWGVLAAHLENTNGSLLTWQNVTVKSKSSGQKWVVRSYGPRAVNSDPYYNENLVLSDLPEGDYQVSIDYLDDFYDQDITIHPGAVTYFSFQGAHGYKLESPPTPEMDEWIKTLPDDTP